MLFCVAPFTTARRHAWWGVTRSYKFPTGGADSSDCVNRLNLFGDFVISLFRQGAQERASGHSEGSIALMNFASSILRSSKSMT